MAPSSAQSNKIAPIKSGRGSRDGRLAPARESELGRSLVGKGFTAVEPEAGTDADLVEYFSTPWRPSVADVNSLCWNKHWIKDVDEGKRGEANAFALIQAAVAEYTKNN